MPQITVLITFYSRCGMAESLAAAAAVGAVQRRGAIRLRRLTDVRPTDNVAAECREMVERMRKEYVAPTEKDIVAVNALVLVPPAGADTAAAEWTDFLRVLDTLHTQGKLAGKVGCVVDCGSEPTRQSFSAALQRLGLSMPPDASASGGDAVARAMERGRAVADLAATARTP